MAQKAGRSRWAVRCGGVAAGVQALTSKGPPPTPTTSCPAGSAGAGAVAALLEAALALFGEEPAKYALRPAVGHVLNAALAAVSAPDPSKAVQDFNDSVAYK